MSNLAIQKTVNKVFIRDDGVYFNTRSGLRNLLKVLTEINNITTNNAQCEFFYRIFALKNDKYLSCNNLIKYIVGNEVTI